MKRIDNNEAIVIQKEILQELDKFCVEHHIRYSLAYGSLLGAVRHKDIIPWDDDIDVMMLRKDFEEFCKIYPKEGKKEYAVENHRTNPEIKTRLAYFTDTRTITYNIGYKKENNIQTYGIHIDVYPVDFIPDNIFVRRLFFWKRSIMFFIVRGAALHPEIRKKTINRVVLNAVKMVCNVFNQDNMIDALVRHCRKYENITPNENTMVSVLLDIGKPICFPYKIFDDFSEYDYAKKKYKGISDYDICLKLWYGDYMKFPPENERVPHKYSKTEYYWK